MQATRNIATAALILVPLLFPPQALSQTATNCTLAWDYAGADHDGFRIYDASTAASLGDIAPDSREAACSDLGLTDGIHTLYATAFNAAGESLPSNSADTPNLVSSVPSAPMTFTITGTVTLTPVP